MTAKQNTAVLNHMKKDGNITAIEALNLYGCFRLAARIYELKKEGFEIVAEQVDIGDNRSIARYSLA